MIEHTCGHTSKRRPSKASTRAFLEGRACGECVVVELIEKLCRLNPGERVQDATLLSKKQSRWLSDMVHRELGIQIPFASTHDSIEVRGHRLSRMGRLFSANGNGDVVHVSRVETDEEVTARKAEIDRDSIRQVLSSYADRSQDAKQIAREAMEEVFGADLVAQVEEEMKP